MTIRVRGQGYKNATCPSGARAVPVIETASRPVTPVLLAVFSTAEVVAFAQAPNTPSDEARPGL